MNFTVTIQRTISNFLPYSYDILDGSGVVVVSGQGESYDACMNAIRLVLAELKFLEMLS